ncbi:50S ribosomal protein L10 [Conexibacter sp. JD483]|uniref:50S ribosomal protein L10 n=1 Tax=unclassified Conexibacter TaxID=2627773 RepID=UPI0027247F60|nr:MULTISPECIES: 50S ribosomal protein L10 [unclassified Conexibacter]MDO8186409.1 50S ribosomal protein L10 [Conexibacter sp. CPCC 205706]MDO8199808.1 50S ribosomal protein L10 [Conexibacter sp. CPCC 205762]MDR9369172.1 50S ribosomal protein L10 [Conexibacter sp. JD483]
MNRNEKAAVIDRIAEDLEASSAVFAVDYRGITVAQVAELRTKLRESDTTLSVVKNSLTERAADKAGAEALKEILAGPTALAFVRGDAAAAAKALSDAQRTTQVLAFKGGLMDGQPVTPDEIRAISRLPSREVLYGQLVGVVAAPLNGLARGLNALIAGVAIQLQAIADQGLVGGNAAAPAPAEEAAPAADAAPAETEAPAAEAEAPAAEATPDTDDKTDDAAAADAASDAKED